MAHGRHIPYLIALQIAFIILFGCLVEYDEYAHGADAFEMNHHKDRTNRLQHYYPSKHDRTTTTTTTTNKANTRRHRLLFLPAFRGFSLFEMDARSSDWFLINREPISDHHVR